MILLISAVFPPEPVVSASISYDLAVALSEDHEVTVLTPRSSRPFGFCFKSEATETRRFNQVILNSYIYPESKLFGRMRESYSFGKHVVKYIKKNQTKIESVYINAWPLPGQYLIVKAVKKYSIPSVIQVMDIYPESLSNKIVIFGKIVQELFLPMDKFILRNVSKIIVISENMLNTLTETRDISAGKIEIVQNWQDESEFIKYHESRISSEERESAEKLFTFMYLGNIGPVAGVDFLIRSFAKANLKGVLLVIAGTGTKKKECIEIAEAYTSLNIKFWDVPAGKVPEMQDQADVMILPVKRGASMSSIPSKLTAFMLSRKPIIACTEEKSDTANAIIKAKCGWIVPSEDLDSMAEAMRKVVSVSKSDLHNYGLNGFKYAMENFSRKTNLQKIVNIIHETLKYRN